MFPLPSMPASHCSNYPQQIECAAIKGREGEMQIFCSHWHSTGHHLAPVSRHAHCLTLTDQRQSRDLRCSDRQRAGAGVRGWSDLNTIAEKGKFQSEGNVENCLTCNTRNTFYQPKQTIYKSHLLHIVSSDKMQRLFTGKLVILRGLMNVFCIIFH